MQRVRMRKLLRPLLLACIIASLVLWFVPLDSRVPFRQSPGKTSDSGTSSDAGETPKTPKVPDMNAAANARLKGGPASNERLKGGAPPLLNSGYAPKDPNIELISQIGGQSRVGGVGKDLLPKPKQIPRPEKYPVENPFQLPSKSARKQLPKIQAEEHKPCADRAGRLKEVQTVMDQTWTRYKQFGFGHDEIHPISGEPRDPFLGWAATLVDALDTLWIMDMKDEFKLAADKVAEIDFTRSGRGLIPVFETTIRYLGGLLSAYDLSGDKRLYYKAIELGDNLIGAFDTPNRMPLLYYRWEDKNTEVRRRAAQGAIVAELGSMTIEFTRLAQLTGNNSYFDAVHRITKEFEKAKDEQAIPGLFPAIVDISGCDTNQEGDESDPMVQLPIAIAPPMRCKKKGITPLTIQPGAEQTFSFGGRIDSLYEYYIKEYILLGGSDDTYKNMYMQSADQGAKMLLYKPNTTSPEEILFSGDIHYKADDMVFDPTMAHLSCFLGGMYAMGGKVLDRPKDVEIGKRLTQGCVYAYGATGTGVMPEDLHVVACGDSGEGIDETCEFEPRPLAPYRPLLEWEKVEGEEEEEEFTGETIGGEKRAKEQSPYSLHDLGIAPRSRRETYPNLRERPSPRDFNPLFKLSEEDLAKVPSKFAGQKYHWRQNGVFDLPRDWTGASPHYLMRPEAIESVYYMYRITGDPVWQDRGWEMFRSVVNLCWAGHGAYASIRDVTDWRKESDRFHDEQESFWVGETLKYYYLLFAEADVVSLDEWVFNTEAHPVRRE
ncbi:Mannosyl-oligosaccharide 1,2-alpha-mannosidase MNS2 [Yarrowia sp. C11]|nr:Mannosyl-oligosaccharide 1,2-alpha-mannosidase MNS2 [Yarrowia sp. E02]KAG5367555.1 Mannosyl-oligosaccharide 1,2-alpha-mannosidase MNS2 [Yarrowia sp. C11]